MAWTDSSELLYAVLEELKVVLFLINVLKVKVKCEPGKCAGVFQEVNIEVDVKLEDLKAFERP